VCWIKTYLLHVYTTHINTLIIILSVCVPKSHGYDITCTHDQARVSEKSVTIIRVILYIVYLVL